MPTKTQTFLERLGTVGASAEGLDNCCNTVNQNLIIKAIERIYALEKEVEWLENNPDVADVVATKAELDAYDTSNLTNNAIVKVLKDETHESNITYYRYDTDTKEFTFIGELAQVVQNTITTEKGTSRIENHPDGGVMTFVTADNKWGGVAVNDGTADILVELYAVDGNNTDGTRIIMNENGAYYTKGDNYERTADDEIVTLKKLDEVLASGIQIELDTDAADIGTLKDDVAQIKADIEKIKTNIQATQAQIAEMMKQIQGNA